MSKAIGKSLVSVVIPAYNEERVIANCLSSLAKQTDKDFEIVIVDDLSDDNTSRVAVKKSNELKINLRFFKLDIHGERGRARNYGAKQAKGEYLLFLDADMLASKGLIRKCKTSLKQENNIGALIIPEESFGRGFWAKCRGLEKKCYLGDNNIEAARFFRKDAFWRVGGWDEEIVSGEDWDLTRRFRRKSKIGRIEAKIFHNEGKLTIWKIIKKKFYYASKAQTYLKKYPPTLIDIILFIFRPAYFRNWRLFLSDPLHGSGVFLLKLTETIAGGLGFLYSKLLGLLGV